MTVYLEVVRGLDVLAIGLGFVVLTTVDVRHHVDVTSSDPARLDAVFAAHGVSVAYLFGSRAEGRERPDSDHDVAVLFGDPADWDATVRLATELAPVFGTEVDVVDLEAATLELRGLVVEKARLIRSVDEPRRVRFEVDTRSRWFDFRPALEETTRGYLRRVAREGLR